MSTDPTETGHSMDCAELARAVDAYLDGELHASDQGQVEAHLRGCEACRATAVREGHVRTALRAQLRAAMGAGTPAGSAPAELRERIHLALVRTGAGSWRDWVTPLRLAAIGACAAGALALYVLHVRPDSIVDEAARKHARGLPLEVTAASGPESISGWFDGKLDFNASPPRLGTPARLVGARLSHIRDRPAAYVRYDLPTGHAGLFIFDDPGRRFEGAGRAVKIGPSTVRLASARGFSVAVWRRNGIVYSLVSDVAESDLSQLVEAAQAPGER